MEKFLFTCVSVVLAALICSHWTPTANADVADLSRTPPNGMGPTISFHYCYSCGYAKAYDEYRQLLQEKYPEIGTIQGQNYDPPGMRLYLSKGVQYTKMLLLFLVIIGANQIWNYLGQEAPGWWNWAQTNKIYCCMMIFFLGNMLEAHLISSGAFEIYYNDVPIWSKLQSGRVPAPAELFQIIDNQLKFSVPMEVNPNFVK